MKTKADACVEKVRNSIKTDKGKASIRAFLSQSKGNYIPSAIWRRLDQETRDQIRDIKNDLASGKDSSPEKKPIPSQYTKANQVNVQEDDVIDEDEVEKLLEGAELDNLMESLGGSKDE